MHQIPITYHWQTTSKLWQCVLVEQCFWIFWWYWLLQEYLIAKLNVLVELWNLCSLVGKVRQSTIPKGLGSSPPEVNAFFKGPGFHPHLRSMHFSKGLGSIPTWGQCIFLRLILIAALMAVPRFSFSLILLLFKAKKKHLKRALLLCSLRPESHKTKCGSVNSFPSRSIFFWRLVPLMFCFSF